MSASEPNNPPVTQRRRSRKSGGLRESSVRTLVRFLEERGLSEDDIDRGLNYAESVDAQTIREGFTAAMSRVMYSDEELEAGARFTFEPN